MKRQSLLFIAGGLMALASCTNEESTTTTNNEVSQASIDSAVNVRVEEMRTQMMMENDSIINEMALYKADSMCAAMKGQAPKPRPKTAAKPSSKGAVPDAGSAPVTTKTPEPNTGKRDDQTGTNTGKRDDQTGTNTGKR